jgi:H+-transporting ATPase
MVEAEDRLPFAHNSTGLVPQFRGVPVTISEIGFTPGKDARKARANYNVESRMGDSGLIFCTAVLAIAKYRLGLGIDMLQTLAFVAVVFGNQATTYTNRERQRLGSNRPSRLLIASSVADVLIVSTLAIRGIAMTPLPILVVGGILVSAAVFAFILDVAKVPVFRSLGIV